MSDCTQQSDTSGISTRGRRAGIWQSFFFGIAVLTVFRVGDAGADPAEANGVAPPRKPAANDWRHSPALSPSLFNVPDEYSMPVLPDTKEFSSRDFRPRGHSIMDSDPRLNIPGENLVDSTTVWQRLYEYRTRDRVQVLTLWNSSASSVSLQAGRKGNPSLQWTSRLMNRGGATRGILDRLVPRFDPFARASHAASAAQGAAKQSNSLGALLRPAP